MKTIASALLLFLCACAESATVTAQPPDPPGGACAESECGAVPPVAPTACPAGSNVSTVCTRNEANACHWQVRCTDR